MTKLPAQQPFPEFYESPNDALEDIVKQLGGYKRVGIALKPEMTIEGAANWLRDCLNPARREKLSLEQALLLLRMGRNAGLHGAMQYLCSYLDYEPPKPIDPEDQAAALQRSFVDAVDRLAAIQAELGRLQATSKARR